MLREYKQEPRTQKLLKRLGSAVESVMDSHPPKQNEKYKDWMSRVGAIYKTSQPTTERKSYVPAPQRAARGYFTKNGQQYFEGNANGGGFYTKQILKDHDQYKG